MNTSLPGQSRCKSDPYMQVGFAVTARTTQMSHLADGMTGNGDGENVSEGKTFERTSSEASGILGDRLVPDLKGNSLGSVLLLSFFAETHIAGSRSLT